MDSTALLVLMVRSGVVQSGSVRAPREPIGVAATAFDALLVSFGVNNSTPALVLRVMFSFKVSAPWYLLAEMIRFLTLTRILVSARLDPIGTDLYASHAPMVKYGTQILSAACVRKVSTGMATLALLVRQDRSGTLEIELVAVQSIITGMDLPAFNAMADDSGAQLSTTASVPTEDSGVELSA